jgi:ketosteroid isomerase-like protein
MARRDAPTPAAGERHDVDGMAVVDPAGPAENSGENMDDHDVDDPIDRLRDAIDSGDAERVADCFTDDYTAVFPLRPADGFTGSEQVRRNWAAMFARVPGLRARVLRRASSGDELWSEWEMSGTGAAEQPVLAGPVVMTVREGKIDWARFYLSPVVGRRSGS